MKKLLRFFLFVELLVFLCLFYLLDNKHFLNEIYISLKSQNIKTTLDF